MVRGAKGAGFPVSSGGFVVRGGGIGGDSYVLVDSFEDADLAEYNGATTAFSIADESNLTWSTAFGSKVLDYPAGNGFNRIYSTTGLANYFPKGNVAKVNLRTTALNGSFRILFGVLDFNDYYIAEADFGSGNLNFMKRVGGTLSTIASDTTVSYSSGTTGVLTIDWQSTDDVQLLYDEGGSTIGNTGVANDTSHSTETGVGFIGTGGTTGETFYADGYRLDA